MDLRAKIAGALVNVQACADTGQPLTVDRYTDAVMRHVAPELDALVARVRELEEDNQQLRDDLEAVKSFAWIADGELIRVTRVSDDPDGWVVDVEDQTVATDLDRDSALSRARDIAKENT